MSRTKLLQPFMNGVWQTPIRIGADAIDVDYEKSPTVTLSVQEALDSLNEAIANIYEILINGGTIAYVDATTESGEIYETENGEVLQFNVLVPTN